MSQAMEIELNIQPTFFGVNVRRNGPQPSICVRTFTPITICLIGLVADKPSCGCNRKNSCTKGQSGSGMKNSPFPKARCYPSPEKGSNASVLLEKKECESCSWLE